jgi:hypothetical protein
MTYLSQALTKLERDVEEAIRLVPNYLGDVGNREWTNAVKLAVAGIMSARGCIVYTNGGLADTRGEEWVFDLCACHQDAAGRLIDIDLVLESEWSSNLHAQQWDFQKLLLARAKLRVFVTEVANQNNVTGVFERCTDEVEASNLPLNGDRFLLCAYDRASESMHSRFVQKI